MKKQLCNCRFLTLKFWDQFCMLVVSIAVTLTLLYIIFFNHFAEKDDPRWNIPTQPWVVKDVMDDDATLDWCCQMGNKYNIIPQKSWGSMDESNPLKAEWADKLCDSIIGGSDKTNCKNKNGVE